MEPRNTAQAATCWCQTPDTSHTPGAKARTICKLENSHILANSHSNINCRATEPSPVLDPRLTKLSVLKSAALTTNTGLAKSNQGQASLRAAGATKGGAGLQSVHEWGPSLAASTPADGAQRPLPGAPEKGPIQGICRKSTEFVQHRSQPLSTGDFAQHHPHPYLVEPC